MCFLFMLFVLSIFFFFPFFFFLFFFRSLKIGCFLLQLPHDYLSKLLLEKSFFGPSQVYPFWVLVSCFFSCLFFFLHVGASRVKRKRDLFLVGPLRRTDWLPVGGDIRGSDEEQVQPGTMSQRSDEFDRSSEEDRSRSEWFDNGDSDDPDDAFAGAGSAFKRHHNPRGEVGQLDGLSVGDADDSDDLDDAFAGAAFQKTCKCSKQFARQLNFFLQHCSLCEKPRKHGKCRP